MWVVRVMCCQQTLSLVWLTVAIAKRNLQLWIISYGLVGHGLSHMVFLHAAHSPIEPSALLPISGKSFAE